MPVQPTYPGVYIEELPVGVRTIAGVSTSTAVFIGRTKQGVMKKPELCLSYADFERVFSSEPAGAFPRNCTNITLSLISVRGTWNHEAPQHRPLAA